MHVENNLCGFKVTNVSLDLLVPWSSIRTWSHLAGSWTKVISEWFHQNGGGNKGGVADWRRHKTKSSELEIKKQKCYDFCLQCFQTIIFSLLLYILENCCVFGHLFRYHNQFCIMIPEIKRQVFSWFWI